MFMAFRAPLPKGRGNIWSVKQFKNRSGLKNRDFSEKRRLGMAMNPRKCHNYVSASLSKCKPHTAAIRAFVAYCHRAEHSFTSWHDSCDPAVPETAYLPCRDRRSHGTQKHTIVSVSRECGEGGGVRRVLSHIEKTMSCRTTRVEMLYPGRYGSCLDVMLLWHSEVASRRLSSPNRCYQKL